MADEEKILNINEVVEEGAAPIFGKEDNAIDEPVVDDVQTQDIEEEVPAEETNVKDAADAEAPKKEKKKKEKKPRKKLEEYTLENDIKYRGILSYRWLRIFAWLFLLVAQVGILLGIGAKMDSGLAESVGQWPKYLKMADELMLPLFLIATFSLIINGSKTLRSILIVYGGGAILLYIVFILFHDRYIAALIMFIADVDHDTAVAFLDFLLSSGLDFGYFTFNIFIDLFMCTLTMLFLIYTPKKLLNKGKKLTSFRIFAIFPIMYELASLSLKLMSGFGVVQLSPYLFPLLTTKPPMTFIVFIAVIMFLKFREKKFLDRGKTEAEYQGFLRTKANSFQFSSYLAIVMVVAGFIDLIIYMILTLAVVKNGVRAADGTVIAETTRELAGAVLLKAGVGGSGGLIIIAPFMLLYNYNKTYKNTKIDLFIPLIAIAAIVIVYLEAFVIATNMMGSLTEFIKSFGG